ncbi:asparaginase [Pseudonocardia acaciae]|uniref:asparaginase n=1 Tax=Pseudonocardia acaciae TaxID=551276 RepID=UPI00048B5ED4|nr:asparaginase [Pseudonocardia acaciae]
MHELVAEVWRSEFLESVHHGSVVALDGAGGVAFAVGQPDAAMFPRSSNKPLQATAMVRAGLDLDGELLALACASHSGEPFHIDGVRRILAGAGRTEEDLRCTEGLPIGERALHGYLARGGAATPLYMNCSGKHAAMIATCVRNGWPVETYLRPEHPLQRAIRDTVEDLAAERVAAVGVDGCGAPLFALTLTGLARAFGRLAASAGDGAEGRVASAMRAHPEWVGGTGRDVTSLMRAVPGAVAKDGAEGVYAVGLPSGAAVALKIADGSGRARPVVAAAALARLGVPAESLGELATAPVLGHGEPVGAVRATI